MAVQEEDPLTEVLDGVMPSHGVECDHLYREVAVVPGGCVPWLFYRVE